MSRIDTLDGHSSPCMLIATQSNSPCHFFHISSAIKRNVHPLTLHESNKHYMATSVKLCFSVFVVSLLVLCCGLALAATDPELKQCRHQCKVQLQYSESEKKECVQRCEDYHREKKEREERGGRRDPEFVAELGSEKGLGQCQRQCDRQQGEERALCRLRCKLKYEGRGGEEETEGDNNPYVFEDEHFTSVVETEHGKLDVLRKFTEKSKLLRGIENYRVAVLEANPQTFVSPSHWDADGVIFVARGRGTISMITEEERRSFNIRRGDVLRIPGGTHLYLVNSDENEKLFIVSVLVPVNIPGEAEVFSSSGTENTESFYEAFSSDLLEAALKTESRRLERIFRQKQGAIVKASREQIRAMSQSEEGGAGIWPFGGESAGPINIFKEPKFKNEYGQFFKLENRYFKQNLRDLDLSVSVSNISRGAMNGPYYNSRVTKISLVLEGDGYIEMACPHLSGSQSPQQRQKGSAYEKVRARLTRGTVAIVPAGHPAAFVASRNNNMQVLCFEINEEGNSRHLLAGKNNIVSQMEKEAKELAFGVSEREVDQAFGKQNQEWFFPGPRRSDHDVE